MTKKSLISALPLFASAALCLPPQASAQTATSFTTLAAAVGRSDTSLTLTACTGVLALGFNNAPQTMLYVDRELMTVTSNVNAAGSGCTWNVQRALPIGGLQTTHASGAVVFFGPPSVFDQGPNDRFGACTATSFAYLPLIQVRTGDVSRCMGGSWVNGTPILSPAEPYTAFSTLSPPNPIATNSTTHVAGTIYFSQIRIPRTVLLTGACQLNGATVTTDKSIVALYDAGGVLIANSAVAGVADSGNASIYQCQAFTSTVVVPGPATYYVALQGNGTTDNFQSYAAGSAPTNYGTQSQTGTFGTLPAMTTPTVTFTANKGPLMLVY